MARQFQSKIRVKCGGTINRETGVYTGGVVVGHFAASYELSATRPTLTSAISNGPTVQKVDNDGDTATIRLELERDSVEARNLGHYAVDAGPVAISSADALDAKVLERYGIFEFGDFGATGQKEAAKESVTLVGTNSMREAAWIAAQSDMPDDE